MAAMTRFDKIVLGLTAAFLVVTGGYFVSGQLGEAEYQVTVSKQVPAVSASLPDTSGSRSCTSASTNSSITPEEVGMLSKL